jgi:phosphonoacetaldehyde hydrolase
MRVPEKLKFLKAIVFDWAGTIVDFGSCAPAAVFQRVFRERGIDITVEQAREPMGMAKREHIAAIANMPSVKQAWKKAMGRDFNEADIDTLYRDFLPMQKEILGEHSALIPGAAQAVAECRTMGLKIGSSTGYTRELMQVVSAAARLQGYEPDCVICAEDAPRGRPAPFLIFEAAKRMDVYPTWAIVKVDDTPVGIEAGRNAGCWTIGVTRSGNCVGKTEQELAQLSAAEIQSLCDVAASKLRTAGAHYLVETVAEVPQVLREIEQAAISGQMPI